MAKVFQLILSLFWLQVIGAQYGGGQSTTTTAEPSSTSESSATSSQSSSGAVQSVDVGEDGFTFNPDTLTVSAGDKVEFHFYPGNHSVTQSSFDNPCQPLSDTSIFSGFVAPTSGESKIVFTLTVNNTDPIWLYCAQVGHCQAGMVAVINPPSGGRNTLDAYKEAAAGTGVSSVPANVQGGILGTPSGGSGSTSSGSVSSSSPSASSSATSDSGSSSSTSSNPTTSNTSSSTLAASTSSSSTSSSTSTSTETSTANDAQALRIKDVSIILVFSVAVAMFMY